MPASRRCWSFTPATSADRRLVGRARAFSGRRSEVGKVAVVGPTFQFVKSPDGIKIAYWTVGEGAPLVIMPNLMMSHGQLEWRTPEYRAWYQALGEGRRLIGYDARGSGMSDREFSDYPIDAHTMAGRGSNRGRRDQCACGSRVSKRYAAIATGTTAQTASAALRMTVAPPRPVRSRRYEPNGPRICKSGSR